MSNEASDKKYFAKDVAGYNTNDFITEVYYWHWFTETLSNVGLQNRKKMLRYSKHWEQYDKYTHFIQCFLL